MISILLFSVSKLLKSQRLKYSNSLSKNVDAAESGHLKLPCSLFHDNAFLDTIQYVLIRDFTISRAHRTMQMFAECRTSEGTELYLQAYTAVQDFCDYILDSDWLTDKAVK